MKFAAITHPGRVHQKNQDALLVDNAVHGGKWKKAGSLPPATHYLLAIADGVSASTFPATASRTVLTILNESFQKNPEIPVSYRIQAIQASCSSTL